eukprot:3256854-Rhodomonas_salina.1
MTESVRARVKTFVWEGVGWTSRQVTPGANRKFLQCVLDESETTAAYLQTNHGSTNDVADLELVLGAVHWGLMSRSSDTAQLSCMALTRLAKSLKSMAEERWQAHLWSWFAREQTSQSSGMTAACACLKAHGTGLGAELSELFAAFCTHHLHDTFRTALPALLRGPGPCPPPHLQPCASTDSARRGSRGVRGCCDAARAPHVPQRGTAPAAGAGGRAGGHGRAVHGRGGRRPGS